MRPWLVQEPSNATAQPLVSGSQQSSDGGIYPSLVTVQERPQLHMLGKMDLHLLGSVVCLEHQGWDIWAAASHPNTQPTGTPLLENSLAPPRGVLGERGRKLGHPRHSGMNTPFLEMLHISPYEVGQRACSPCQHPGTSSARPPGAPGLHPGHVTGRGFAEGRCSHCTQGKLATREGISSAAFPSLLAPWISQWRSKVPLSLPKRITEICIRTTA